MIENALNKVKNKVFGATNNALMHVELAKEEAHLKAKYQSLGQKLHLSIQGDLLHTMKSDPLIVSLLGEIEETKRRIDDLQSKLTNK